MAKKITNRVVELDMVLLDEPDGIVRLEIDIDQIKELADSIRSEGQLQPILVRPKNKRYEIIFGHRRYLANKSLGLKKILATVKELDDKTAIIMKATENIQRVDMSPIEEAAVYLELMENAGLSAEEVGRRMGKSSGLVKRRMELLRMPPQLQQAVHKKQIPYTAAEELWRLGDLNDIDYYLGFAIDHGATVSVIRNWVNEKIAERRRQQGDVGEGRGILSPMESKPHYVACDLCEGAMTIGDETVIRACPNCVSALKEAMKGGG